ncbi:hypothetical protein Csa_009534 [Cucumis sativus]|nr:hypothetical protein Csa_009534 [Cucumis sativus]
MLLGVKAVIAKSFEHTHRSNLVGMGIITLCFKQGEDTESLGLSGHKCCNIDLPNSIKDLKPFPDITGTTEEAETRKSFQCTLRVNTEVELTYFDHGGILHYVIRSLINTQD